MLWFTIWFMVILKIPVLYVAWVIWWAVKDPPEPVTGTAADGLGPGPGWRPSRDRFSRRPGRGPHGSPDRRPLPGRLARVRARARAR